MATADIRRRRYREPMIYIGIASVCSALARASGVLWIGVPLLAIGVICLIVGVIKMVRTVKALPSGERSKERRNMVLGAVGAIVFIAVGTGVILLIQG